MARALIVIDIQNYFININTKDLPGKVAKHIEKNRFDFVLFTKFVNKPTSNFFKILKWKKCMRAPDTDISATLLKYVNAHNVFEKETYSLFKSKKLVNFLKKNGVSKLYLCGIDSDGCVLASAYDGFDAGYNVEILADLCKSHYGAEMHEAAIKIIRKNLP